MKSTRGIISRSFCRNYRGAVCKFCYEVRKLEFGTDELFYPFYVKYWSGY